MNRFLTFHLHDTTGNAREMSPAYCLDNDYTYVSLQAYAGTAPLRDSKFDIYADGVSIFNNRYHRILDEDSGVDITETPDTTIGLSAGLTRETYIDNFNANDVLSGTWITCKCLDAGGGRDYTLQLELEEVSDTNEE
jgi:hypothetical protein